MMRSIVDDVLDAMVTPRSYRQIPAVNVRKTSVGYEVDTIVPGFRDSDLTIQWEGAVVTIRGHRDHKDLDEVQVLRRDYDLKDFELQWEAPRSVDISKAKASLQHGILTVLIPVASTATGQIPLNAVE